MKSYRELKVWQESYKLTLRIYKITEKFPKAEKYGLTSQIRKSASSVSANIAEGFNRRTSKEYLHFLYVAKGSLQETDFFCLLANDLKYLSIIEHKKIIERIDLTGKLLSGLIRSISRK
jgi:four helix bundle protein